MKKVGVIGLGYVGLPLAVEIAKNFPVVGYDISDSRVKDLKEGIDVTKEVPRENLLDTSMQFTANEGDLASCDFYIITVPTPVTRSHQPDLRPIESASRTVARYLKKGDIVVYESTVYPGCTEEFCVPILEEVSRLKYNIDFFCGYSPERINPGDKERTITNIKKLVSGSNEETLNKVAQLYGSIIEAGVYPVSSIKVAEAAKVIENAQRDINIAFVNELSLIFEKMELDTQEVLNAASTKWNFLQFSPGLVGGHCIGVDPYYLTFKAETLGYHPQIILAGRRINDGMGVHVANRVVKLMIRKGIGISGSRVLVMGMTFKENCPDIRNSKVVDIIDELRSFGCNVDVFDPNADPREVESEYKMSPLDNFQNSSLEGYDAVIIAVAHNVFLELDWQRVDLMRQVVFDVKGLLPPEYSDGRL